MLEPHSEYVEHRLGGRQKSPRSGRGGLRFGKRSPTPLASSSLGAEHRLRGRQKSPRSGRGGLRFGKRSPTPLASSCEVPRATLSVS